MKFCATIGTTKHESPKRCKVPEAFLRTKCDVLRTWGYARCHAPPLEKAAFDSIASFYPLLEQVVFGSTLSRARNFFARRVMEGNDILLIGEGNGRFLFEMVRQTPSASFTVVDSSPRMLASAARRISAVDRCARIEWVHADILEWQSPVAHYDRVVTHFLLDLFTPYRICRIVEKISHLATEQTLWINVDFTPENRRFRQKLLMWAQYRFFRIVARIEASRLFDSVPYIRQAGWEVLERRSLESGWISAHLMCKSVAQPCVTLGGGLSCATSGG
jgi:ubiquinone/menaquinone biosynthesis C-methylase UbiE